MQITITARHLRLTSAISDYVHKKLAKAERYFDHLIWAQVILDIEKERHIAEIVIHTTGRTFMAKEQSADLYAAIDLASDNIDEQLRRFKERRRTRHSNQRSRSRARRWVEEMAQLPMEAYTPEHRVSSMKTLRLLPLSLKEAVAAMEQTDSAHWIFLNKDNNRTTVLYRKPDKTYGVVEAVV